MLTQGRDSALDYVVTEQKVIVTGNTDPRPSGVACSAMQPDQFEQTPFLKAVRARQQA
jgi:hypothetical protein